MNRKITKYIIRKKNQGLKNLCYKNLTLIKCLPMDDKMMHKHSAVTSVFICIKVFTHW